MNTYPHPAPIRLAVALLVLVVLTAGCSGGDAAQATGDSASATTVEARSSTFTPQTATVAAGGTVTWSNADSVPHTVTFEGDEAASSDTLEPGASFEATFADAGTYAYVCTLHPGMTGLVEVSAS